MPCIPALDPLVSALSRYLGASISTRVGAHLRLDTDYFNRMDALNYAIGHDDGQGGQDLDRADVVLVGVSRTSKTPTCIYLAHRGVRAANVPLVPGRPPPEQLFELNKPLVVGLTVSPDRLIQIRRNRLLSLKEERESAYIDVDAVRDEIVQRPPALRAPRLAGDRRDPPLGGGDRRGDDQPAARRPRPGGGARVSLQPIVLASKSAARRAVLEGAGVPSRPRLAGVDEDAAKAALLAEGAAPRDGGRRAGRS